MSVRYLMGLVMNRGHPLFERVDDLVHRVGDMGFWSCQANQYFDRMLIRTMIRRMRVIYNYQHGLNNTDAMSLVNEALKDDNWPHVETPNSNTDIHSICKINIKMIKLIDLEHMNEDEFIEKFYRRTDRHLLETIHLTPAFIILGGGHCIAAIVLIGEICWARRKLYKVCSFNLIKLWSIIQLHFPVKRCASLSKVWIKSLFWITLL